jgi:prophage tail gpP-like protein
MTDDLTLKVNNQDITGWDSIRVTRGVERCPSDFDILLTERYLGEAADLVVQPGDPCQVFLGADLVITGYIDRVTFEVTGSARHDVRIVGRGKCCDLVDCAAQWPGAQILSCSVLQIAQKLAEYNSITVSAQNDDGRSNFNIPQFNLMLSETSWEVIERICRFAQLLAYDGPDGNLILSGIGKQSAASGFTQGVNVQSMRATYSQDQRYSEYVAFLQSVDVFIDSGDGGNLLGTYKDSGVLRPRRHVTIAEQGSWGAAQQVCEQRAAWEAARRFGRSAQVCLTTDSWRDSSGVLYAPNTLVNLSLPAIKTDNKTWVISEVTYNLQEGSGTTCELVIMPQEAFLPQPTLLQSFALDVKGAPPS